MYFKGMSGWNAAELEDIGWDVFGRSDDHIVPYQGIELLAESSAPGDTQKKLWHESKNDVGKNICSTGVSTKDVLSVEDTSYPQNESPFILAGSQAHAFNVVVPTLHDIESTSSTIVLPSHDVRILDSCLNESNCIAKRKLPFSRDSSRGTTVLINESKSCLSSFNGLSPDGTSLSSLENGKKARDNDLAYYDLPDISNFEDIDKMFRNWDSTFGQDHNGTTDELSWFSSSSNTIYGSEIASDLGFQSPSLDLGALHAKLESHCPNANLLPKNVPVAADHTGSTSFNFAGLLDTDASLTAKSAGKEKSIDGLNHVGITQISNDSLNLSRASDVKVETQQASGDKRTKISPDLMLLGIDASAPQIYSPTKFSHEKHFRGSSSSSYMTNLDPHIQMEFGLPAHQLPFTQIASSFETEQGTNPSSSYNASDHVVNHPIQCPGQFFMPQSTADKEDVDKMYQRQKLCGRMTAEHSHQPGFQIKASVQTNLKTRDEAELDNAGLLLPILERVHPTAQESSGMPSVSSDNISEKVTSFQQLHDILYQLDVGTKLCIRDSLYRLARSARQRHGFTLQNCSNGATHTKGIPGASKSQDTTSSNSKVLYKRASNKNILTTCIEAVCKSILTLHLNSVINYLRSAHSMNAETNTNPIDRSIAHLLFHKPFATRSADDTKSLESGITVRYFDGDPDRLHQS